MKPWGTLIISSFLKEIANFCLNGSRLLLPPPFAIKINLEQYPCVSIWKLVFKLHVVIFSNQFLSCFECLLILNCDIVILIPEHCRKLICAAVTKRTCRCSSYVVYVVSTTISHCDGFWPIAAAIIPMKTDSSPDLTISHWGMSTSQISRCMSVATVLRLTGCGHSWTCRTFKTKPARESTVTIRISISVRYMSVPATQTLVVLTFWHGMPARFSISCVKPVTWTAVRPCTIDTWPKTVAAMNTAGTFINVSVFIWSRTSCLKKGNW